MRNIYTTPPIFSHVVVQIEKQYIDDRTLSTSWQTIFLSL